jgi:hypothetical protein
MTKEWHVAYYYINMAIVLWFVSSPTQQTLLQYNNNTVLQYNTQRSLAKEFLLLRLVQLIRRVHICSSVLHRVHVHVHVICTITITLAAIFITVFIVRRPRIRRGPHHFDISVRRQNNL